VLQNTSERQTAAKTHEDEWRIDGKVTENLYENNAEEKGAGVNLTKDWCCNTDETRCGELTRLSDRIPEMQF
jgi:hypothetical protein